MEPILIVGIMAAVCTTASFVPQAVKTLKTKETKDLSLGMYSIFTLGVALWLGYGIWIRDIPIILANVVTQVLSATILTMKLRHG